MFRHGAMSSFKMNTKSDLGKHLLLGCLSLPPQRHTDQVTPCSLVLVACLQAFGVTQSVRNS